MKEYKRLKDNLDILENHNEIHTPIFHLTDGKTHEQDLIRELIIDCRELLNKIENGTLVELPCKVGDTFYHIYKYSPTPRIEENIVHTIEMFEARDGFNIRIWTQNGTFFANNMLNVFKSKAKAEEKLKELKGEV